MPVSGDIPGDGRLAIQSEMSTWLHTQHTHSLCNYRRRSWCGASAGVRSYRMEADRFIRSIQPARYTSANSSKLQTIVYTDGRRGFKKIKTTS